MNKEEFRIHYPFRKSDSNKYDNGVTAFLSGSYGMAGAALFNIIGARSAGASYIHSYLPGSIYQIVASNELSAVYHPFDENEKDIFDEDSFRKVKAISVGSGINNLKFAKDYMEQILKTASVPVIVDAQGLRILAENDAYYSLNHHLILTPHLGEFSVLTSLSAEKIRSDRREIACRFASEKGVILILKGPETLVVSPNGDAYVNNSGNAALAQAGSGDVLSGMVCGLCALYEDPFMACIDAVWLHGHLADMAMGEHVAETFDLRSFPQLADRFFFDLKKGPSKVQ